MWNSLGVEYARRAFNSFSSILKIMYFVVSRVRILFAMSVHIKKCAAYSHAITFDVVVQTLRKKV